MNNIIKKTVGYTILLLVLIALPHFLKFQHQDLLVFLTINVLVNIDWRMVINSRGYDGRRWLHGCLVI